MQCPDGLVTGFGQKSARTRRNIGARHPSDADGFAPVIGPEGFDVFHLGELEGLEEQGSARRLRGEKQIPRLLSGGHRALAAMALAGLKTRHYNLRAQRYGWPARGARQ
jgi:hypothetical protein